MQPLLVGRPRAAICVVWPLHRANCQLTSSQIHRPANEQGSRVCTLSSRTAGMAAVNQHRAHSVMAGQSVALCRPALACQAACKDSSCGPQAEPPAHLCSVNEINAGLQQRLVGLQRMGNTCTSFLQQLLDLGEDPTQASLS